MLKMRNNFRKDFGISYNKHLFIKIIDVQMTYNVVFNLFCTASDSDMHESILHFHFCEAHHRISNRAPCALQQDFVDYPSYLYWFASVNPKLPVYPSPLAFTRAAGLNSSHLLRTQAHCQEVRLHACVPACMCACEVCTTSVTAFLFFSVPRCVYQTLPRAFCGFSVLHPPRECGL